MTQLIEATKEFALEAEASPYGRWIRFRHALRTVYVLESPWGEDYYVWSDPPVDPSTELYRTPREAIRAGLHYAAAG